MTETFYAKVKSLADTHGHNDILQALIHYCFDQSKKVAVKGSMAKANYWEKEARKLISIIP